MDADSGVELQGLLDRLLCFLLAVLVPFVPFNMSLVIGSLISLTLTFLWLLMRRVAREVASP
jgi:hypothetical protein